MSLNDVLDLLDGRGSDVLTAQREPAVAFIPGADVPAELERLLRTVVLVGAGARPETLADVARLDHSRLDALLAELVALGLVAVWAYAPTPAGRSLDDASARARGERRGTPASGGQA